MEQKKYSFDQFKILKHLLRWTLLVLPVAVTIGSLVALFLWLLDLATCYRWEHLWLLFLLPLAGVGITAVYRLYGKDSERGNNLIIDEYRRKKTVSLDVMQESGFDVDDGVDGKIFDQMEMLMRKGFQLLKIVFVRRIVFAP